MDYSIVLAMANCGVLHSSKRAALDGLFLASIAKRIRPNKAKNRHIKLYLHDICTEIAIFGIQADPQFSVSAQLLVLLQAPLNGSHQSTEFVQEL